MSQERPWLILPVETKARELDAKTYFGCVAAEAGFRVILGGQQSILRRLALLPSGFYLDKSVARPKVAGFQRLNDVGFRVVAWCEEGLVYRNRDSYLHERVAPAAFNRTEAFFAWGQNQADDVQSVVGEDDRIHLTGNPRFDLLRPEMREFYAADAAALRQRFGSYILINTNFSRYNHFYGSDRVLEILRSRGILRHEADERFYEGWVAFLRSAFESFVDMLPRLARKFPRQTIVLRPHPSENHETWHRIAADMPNVRVVYEGGVVPWVLGAELSIHNSCTTGLESCLLDRPVLAYRTVESETYDSYLPNLVSVNLTSFDDLVSGVEEVLAGKYRAPMDSDPAVAAVVDRYITGRTGLGAADRIAGHLADVAANGVSGGGYPLLGRVRDGGEQFALAVASALIPRFRESQLYVRQKFPGLATREVMDLVDRYRNLTGRFGGVRVRRAFRNAAFLSGE